MFRYTELSLNIISPSVTKHRGTVTRKILSPYHYFILKLSISISKLKRYNYHIDTKDRGA